MTKGEVIPDSMEKEGNRMLKDLVLKNRSYRRFHQEVSIELETLKEFVDLARLSASALNLQPLKYVLSCEPRKNALIFSHLGWAGYLKGWPGPAEGERPSAYIIVLGDTEISRAFGCDHGIAAQSILLGATERGLGGCMIATVKRQELSQALDIATRYEILLVIALGKPKETVAIEEVGTGGDVRYWRGKQRGHQWPKTAPGGIVCGMRGR